MTPAPPLLLLLLAVATLTAAAAVRIRDVSHPTEATSGGNLLVTACVSNDDLSSASCASSKQAPSATASASPAQLLSQAASQAASDLAVSPEPTAAFPVTSSPEPVSSEGSGGDGGDDRFLFGDAFESGSGGPRLQQQDSDGGGPAVRLHYRAMFGEEKSVGMYQQDGTGLYAASIPAADLPASGKGVIIS